ncbi:hypothetical protein CR513_27661, partial [Mucuna pruriens]
MPRTVGWVRRIHSTKPTNQGLQIWVIIYKDKPHNVGIEAATSHGPLTLHTASYETYEEIGGEVGKLGGGLDSMRIDIESINAKNQSVSIHESEGSHHEGPNSLSIGSFQSHRSVRSERHERPMRVRRHGEELRKGPFKDTYLEQEMKIYQNLECFDFDERKNVRLIILEYGWYSLVWWNQLIYDMRAMRRAPIESWHELRREMRDRLVPTSYVMDMHNELQRLYQGSKSVEEYFKEITVALVRAQVLKS